MQCAAVCSTFGGLDSPWWRAVSSQHADPVSFAIFEPVFECRGSDPGSHRRLYLIRIACVAAMVVGMNVYFVRLIFSFFLCALFNSCTI